MKARESIITRGFPIRSSFPAGAEREAFGCANIISFCVDDDENEKREKKRNERTSGSSSSRLSTNENGWFPPPILCRSVFVAREENEVKKDVPFNNEKSDAIHV